jgi:hypothetical protein
MNKFNYIIIWVLSLVITPYLVAQNDTIIENNKSKTNLYKDYYIYEGDTMLIELDEVHLFKKLNFKTQDDRNYYYWLRKKVHKSYPYAVIAQERMEVINGNLKNLKNKRQKKIYLKRLQEYFEGEFTEQLKNLTITEGRVLIKLIHRQTGLTVYDLSKEYKNGWSAFWNQKTARLFKQDLKDKYEPATDNEDFLTELILERAFEEHTLIKKPTVLNFDLEKIKKNNGNYIPIERRI